MLNMNAFLHSNIKALEEVLEVDGVVLLPVHLLSHTYKLHSGFINKEWLTK